MSERTAAWVLRSIGVLMLLVGIGALVVAPLEMICFSWFSEGGRFGYEGFGFGSFMFGNLTMQILGYYAIAALTIPLGYAHWTLRRSTRPVVLALGRIWWILGIPLLAVFLFILLASKELTIGGSIAAAVIALLAYGARKRYGALPVVLPRFYRSDCVRHVLERGKSIPTWAERLGVPTLVVLGIELFWVAALHVLIFLSGLFGAPDGVGYRPHRSRPDRWGGGHPSGPVLGHTAPKPLGAVGGAGLLQRDGCALGGHPCRY